MRLKASTRHSWADRDTSELRSDKVSGHLPRKPTGNFTATSLEIDANPGGAAIKDQPAYNSEITAPTTHTPVIEQFSKTPSHPTLGKIDDSGIMYWNDPTYAGTLSPLERWDLIIIPPLSLTFVRNR